MGRKAVVVLAVLLGLFIVGGLVVNFYPVADFASETINDASKSAPPRAIEPARESNRDVYPPLPNSYPDEASQDSIGQGSTPYGEAKDQVNRDLDSRDEATKASTTDRLKLDDTAKLDTSKSAPSDSPIIPAASDKAVDEEAMHSNASKASQDESTVTAPETDKTDKTTNSYESKTSKDESKGANDSSNEDSKAREVDSITNNSPSENSENIKASVASPMEADSAVGDNETSTEDESIKADKNKPNEKNRTHSLDIENEASPSPNPNATIDSTDSTTSESSSDEYRGNENNQIDPMVSPSAPISMLDAEDEEDENANEVSEASISTITQSSSELGENKIDSIASRPNANETNETSASPPPRKNKARSPTCQVAPSCNAASIIKGLATASIQSHANVRYNEIKRLEGAAAAQDFLALWQATRASILPKLVARVSNLKEESSSTDFRQRICRVSYYTEVLEDLGENWVDKKGDRSPNYQVSYTVSCANGEVNLSISSSSAKKLSPTKPSNLLRTESKTTDLRNATRDSLPSCNEPAIQAALNKTGTTLHLRARIHEEASRKGNAAGRGFLALWEETKSLIEPKLRSHILSIQPQGVRGAARICLASYYTEVLEDFGHGWSDKRGARSANYLLRFSLRRKDEGGIELQVLSHKKRVRHF